MKITDEGKIQMYQDWIGGMGYKKLSKKYGITMSACQYVCNIIHTHGANVLISNKNMIYPKELKQKLIDLVLLDRRSVNSVSIEYGLLNRNTLSKWVERYIKNGYVLLENGARTDIMNLKKHKPQKSEELSRIKQLEKENEYLRAENDYIKKLIALDMEKQREKKKLI